MKNDAFSFLISIAHVGMLFWRTETLANIYVLHFQSLKPIKFTGACRSRFLDAIWKTDLKIKLKKNLSKHWENCVQRFSVDVKISRGLENWEKLEQILGNLAWRFFSVTKARKKWKKFLVALPATSYVGGFFAGIEKKARSEGWKKRRKYSFSMVSLCTAFCFVVPMCSNGGRKIFRWRKNRTDICISVSCAFHCKRLTHATRPIQRDRRRRDEREIVGNFTFVQGVGGNNPCSFSLARSRLPLPRLLPTAPLACWLRLLIGKSPRETSKDAWALLVCVFFHSLALGFFPQHRNNRPISSSIHEISSVVRGQSLVYIVTSQSTETANG